MEESADKKLEKLQELFTEIKEDIESLKCCGNCCHYGDGYCLIDDVHPNDTPPKKGGYQCCVEWIQDNLTEWERRKI